MNGKVALCFLYPSKSATPLAQGWIYSDYQMTVFSTAEENLAADKLGGPTLFFPEEALRLAGARVVVNPPWKSNVVVDRELITGQNPYSDKELAQTLLNALKSKAKSTSSESEVHLTDADGNGAVVGCSY